MENFWNGFVKEAGLARKAMKAVGRATGYTQVKNQFKMGLRAGKKHPGDARGAMMNLARNKPKSLKTLGKNSPGTRLMGTAAAGVGGAGYLATKDKTAASKEKPEGHQVRRFFLGNPISSAIEAKKGKKMKSFGESWKHQAKEGIKGLAKGVTSGAAGGMIASLASRGKIKPKSGAGWGAAGGGYVGSLAGSLKGQHGDKASKLHGKYSKNKK